MPGAAAGVNRTFVAYSVAVPGSVAMPFFIGPKDFDILRASIRKLELVRAIDFGMFASLVVPLLQALKWVNGFVGNYGWSIIVLTILINLLDLPAAPPQHGVDAEDAGAAAGGEGDPGSLREVQGHRSRAPEDEPGDDGALQAEGRQSRRAAACRCC